MAIVSALSRRQIKDADRVGGIELMILWPDSLGPEPDVALDHEREASAEKAVAEAIVRTTLDAQAQLNRLDDTSRPPYMTTSRVA